DARTADLLPGIARPAGSLGFTVRYGAHAPGRAVQAGVPARPAGWRDGAPASRTRCGEAARKRAAVSDCSQGFKASNQANRADVHSLLRLGQPRAHVYGSLGAAEISGLFPPAAGLVSSPQ